MNKIRDLNFCVSVEFTIFIIYDVFIHVTEHYKLYFSLFPKNHRKNQNKIWPDISATYVKQF